MFGLRPEDYEDELNVKVFRQNVESVNVFVSMGTQWRVGPGGPYGLDYGTLYLTLTEMGILDKDRRVEVIKDIRTLEDAALEQMRKDKPD